MFNQIAAKLSCILCFTLVLMLSACEQTTPTTKTTASESQSASKNDKVVCAADETPNSGNSTWVFMQINVDQEDGEMDSFYYYARISKNLLSRIKNNKTTSGFINLLSVRYWGDDDLLHEYKSEEYSGELVFRIEDIKKIDLVHAEPIVGLGYDQFKNRSKVSPQPAAKKSDI